MGSLSLAASVGVGVLAAAVYAVYKFLNKETSSTQVTANSKRATESAFVDVMYNGKEQLEENDRDQSGGSAYQAATQAFIQMIHDHPAAGGCGMFTVDDDSTGYEATNDFGVVESGTELHCAGA